MAGYVAIHAEGKLCMAMWTREFVRTRDIVERTATTTQGNGITRSGKYTVPTGLFPISSLG
jgi:hypothetical protein